VDAFVSVYDTAFGGILIVSFKGRVTEAIAGGTAPRGFPPDLVARAERRLRAIDNAVQLSDLRSPPGNHLEALKGNRSGQHSIRINDQWRICFRWTTAGAEDVEIVDYH
jgi:proteic killer suppression protein